MKNEIDLSIIIPVYFNEGSIHLTYKKLTENIFVKFPSLVFEIIIIDDGSMDNSFNEILGLKQFDERIRIIRFTRNFGQVSAFYAGYSIARGKGILNIAADLQEPEELIISIINSFICKEAYIIVGQRIERDESFYRKKTSKFFYSIMQKLSFPNLPYGGFDIVLLDEKVKDFILKSNESNPFWQGQILWSGFSIKFIPYNRLKRQIGKSKWTFSKKIKYLIDGILGYSYLPLRMMSIAGFSISIVGFIYAIIIIIERIIGNSPFKGWAPIMVVILILSGIQMLMLGIIGEYLWRTLDQVRNRPKFIIENVYE